MACLLRERRGTAVRAVVTGGAVTGGQAVLVEGRRAGKVSDRTVPGSTAAPSRVLAMVAPVTCSGLVPYRFDSRTRTRLPPLLTRTTCRTVWSAKPSDQFGPVVSLPGTGGCIADAQVADHRAAG
jgi:hypothetical protein